jgi:Tol biopolymer transport system component
MILLPVLACNNHDRSSTDPGGDNEATYTIVDNCNGSDEFLAIPEGADIIFAAGIYAEAPFPDGVESPCEIYAMDLDTRTIYRVSCSNYTEPTCDYGRVSLSPDRSKAVLVRSRTDSNGDQKINYLDRKVICILDLATENIVELQGFNAVNAPEWSVNNEIVFAANTPTELNTDIWKVDANGQNLQNLTNTPDSLENDCSWSKDGSEIVYNRGVLVDVEPPPGEVSWQSAIVDLMIMDHNGGQKTKIVSFGGSVCSSYTETTVDRYCKGIVVDPNFYPSGDKVVYSMLISIEENQGRGRWNVFSAATLGLDQDITNLTEHPTSFQDVARVSERGIVFHETNQDAQPAFYGLVFMDLQGNHRQELINSQWRYFVYPAEWLP